MSASVSRVATPVFDGRGRQVGRITSSGWSPTLKAMLALASVEARFAAPGSLVSAEWTVEGARDVVPARVVPLPFLDLSRKRE